jgi:hypothetical protein
LLKQEPIGGGGVCWGGFRGDPHTAKRESGDDHEMRGVAA